MYIIKTFTLKKLLLSFMIGSISIPIGIYLFNEKRIFCFAFFFLLFIPLITFPKIENAKWKVFWHSGQPWFHFTMLGIFFICCTLIDLFSLKIGYSSVVIDLISFYLLHVHPKIDAPDMGVMTATILMGIFSFLFYWGSFCALIGISKAKNIFNLFSNNKNQELSSQ